MSFHEGKRDLRVEETRGGKNSQAAPLLTLMPPAFTDGAIGVVALIEGLYSCTRVF